ncbi:hypothetical protein [Kitasatospora sp. NPDC085879]|uniref:hypothetical protein n=1 Tax=Kitasatospora sp. NPDC085879 TaxID=3154769 RepID=UPI0034400819
MTTHIPPVVARTTCWWNFRPGPGGRVSGSELIHDAVNLFSFADAGGVTAQDSYEVDRWTNHGDPQQFQGVPFAPLRAVVAGLVPPTASTLPCALAPGASLLDPVLAALITTPNGWKWRPEVDRAEGFVFPAVLATAEERRLAVHLVSLRGAVEARTVLMGKLNVGTVDLVVNGGRPTQQAERLTIDWGPVFRAGRAAIVTRLRARAAVVQRPPSTDEAGREMNGIIAADMFAASPALTRLQELNLIAVNGRDGKPFKKEHGTTKMVDDRSGDLHAAYNHIRFLLYLEWRALRELL